MLIHTHTNQKNNTQAKSQSRMHVHCALMFAYCSLCKVFRILFLQRIRVQADIFVPAPCSQTITISRPKRLVQVPQEAGRTHAHVQVQKFPHLRKPHTV